jgi:hypothetical protein
MDLGGIGGDDLPGAIGAVVFVLAVVLVAIPLLLFAVEVLVLFLAVVLAFVVRVVFRRPWHVEAVTDGPPADRQVFRVVGWRRSGEVMAEAAQLLALGHRPPLPLS